MSKEHDVKHSAMHLAHFALHTEPGKRAAHAAVSTLATVAAPALIAVGTVAAPLAFAGVIALGIWRLIKE